MTGDKTIQRVILDEIIKETGLEADIEEGDDEIIYAIFDNTYLWAHLWIEGPRIVMEVSPFSEENTFISLFDPKAIEKAAKVIQERFGG